MTFSILEVIISVFFTALIVSVVFRHFKLSVILGYLVVGTLVGPHILGLVPNSHYIDTLAEFGIVFLMFTVGLEFSLAKLISLRMAVIVVGGLQVLLCITITSLVGMLLNMTLTASLIIGCIVAMSSTALVIKQLNEQRELHSKHGMYAFAVLLFQDLAVIPIIILISTLVKGSGNNLLVSLIFSIIKGIFAITLIFILGRWILKPLFHFISKTKAIELFTLTVLLVTIQNLLRKLQKKLLNSPSFHLLLRQTNLQHSQRMMQLYLQAVGLRH